MREIKFRAARGKDIIGVYTLEEIYQSGAQSESDAYWGNDEDKLNLNPDNIYKGKSEEPVVFYQYTGLHDKNGKEIYEGDIVTDSVRVGEIGFAQSIGAFNWTYGVNWGEIDSETLEVIGNVYENPELLKENS